MALSLTQALLVLVAAVLAYVVYQHLIFVPLGKEHFDLTEHVVSLEGLPLELEGKTILQLSDIHVDLEVCSQPRNNCTNAAYLTERFLERVVEEVNRVKPDIVVLTGDYVVYQKEAIDQLSRALAKMSAPKYAVLGNHDHVQFGSAAYISNSLRKAGVVVLENQTVYPFGPGLALVGLAELWANIHDGSERFNPAKALKDVPSNMPRIVLSHQPDTFQFLKNFRSDLVLCGHTHGAQFALPLIGPLFPYYVRFARWMNQRWNILLPFGTFRVITNLNWMSGFHTEERLNGDGGVNRMYINRGLGSLFGARLFCDPELSLFTLVSAPSSLLQKKP